MCHIAILFFTNKILNFTKNTPLTDFCECGCDSLGYVKAGPYLSRRILVR
jgi:hypothetical protein